MLTLAREISWPYNKVDMWPFKHRRDMEKVLVGIQARLEMLERVEAPEDHGDAIDRLQANLDGLRDHDRDLGELHFQMQALGARVDSLQESLTTRLESLQDNDERTVLAITALRDEAKRTTLAVADGIERVDRAHHRIKQTVARAKTELKKLGYSDPGVEAEDRELRLVDGTGSDTGGLQPVQEAVGSPEDAPSSVAGVTVGQLMRGREQYR